MQARSSQTSSSAQSRKEERHKERQAALQRLVQAGEIDWEELIGYKRRFPGETFNPNYSDRSGVTIAHLSAYNKQPEILQWCIDTRADVNARNVGGRSVLHYACDGGAPKCVALLLNLAADVNMKTLSQLTPLHICCQNSSSAAIKVLLEQHNQVVDIEAEDSRRRKSEALTDDAEILMELRKYADRMDDERKRCLLDAAVVRLFNLFDRNGDGFILPEEHAETVALLAMHFEHWSEAGVDDIFACADLNADGKIDKKEFQSMYMTLLEALGLSFRRVIDSLDSIERLIFEEKVRIETRTTEAKETIEHPMTPVVSDRAKTLSRSLSLRRTRTPNCKLEDSVVAETPEESFAEKTSG